MLLALNAVEIVEVQFRLVELSPNPLFKQLGIAGVLSRLSQCAWHLGPFEKLDHDYQVP